MKSATTLKNMHTRIELLKSQRDLAWIEWHKLNDLEQRNKEQGKELSQTFALITKLTYEIRGLQITFGELKEQVIKEIILS
ncbi:hypothetical protein pEaSNUABM44_00453 [Erwinia phage pEa_SNUABM_44]|nr:hypothetical protein pEaSNUABM44_00453 [Erwinia phage pEa_SNUABM_44]